MRAEPGRLEIGFFLKRRSHGLMGIVLLLFFHYALSLPGTLFAEGSPDTADHAKEETTHPLSNTDTGSLEIKRVEKSGGMIHPLFPLPEALKKSVDFWIAVYSSYSTTEMVIHDSKYLDIIFEVKKVSDKIDTTGAYLLDTNIEREVNLTKEHYADQLKLIHKKINSGKSLSIEEQKLADLYDSIGGSKKFLSAADRVRAQPGMRERFLQGVERSGLFLDRMKEIFRESGLPVELTVLPHVESSFNPTAYSSVGAAGAWQFMRATGSEYMSINYSVDERLDPIESTRAAARLLKRNFQALESWPMAIIAYNYGLGGMQRAKRKMRGELVDIIKGYKSRLFGFASQNFYSEFLAALAISNDIPRYFGKVRIDPPLQFETHTLEHYISIDDLSKYLKIDRSVIKRYNPALRAPVLKSEKLLPRGYGLNLPIGEGFIGGDLLPSIPKGLLKGEQIASKWYRVMPGDNLSMISRRFKTTVASLVEINKVRRAGRIYAGQILEIPPKNWGSRIDRYQE